MSLILFILFDFFLKISKICYSPAFEIGPFGIFFKRKNLEKNYTDPLSPVLRCGRGAGGGEEFYYCGTGVGLPTSLSFSIA